MSGILGQSIRGGKERDRPSSRSFFSFLDSQFDGMPTTTQIIIIPKFFFFNFSSPLPPLLLDLGTQKTWQSRTNTDSQNWDPYFFLNKKTVFSHTTRGFLSPSLSGGIADEVTEFM